MPAAFVLFQTEEPQPDAGRSLHQICLGLKEIGFCPVFGLHPPHPRIIQDGCIPDLFRELLGKIQIFRFTSNLKQTQKEIGHTGRPAANATIWSKMSMNWVSYSSRVT